MDIMIRHKERVLLIEIAVIHYASQKKMRFLRDENIPAIEIDAKKLIAQLYNRHDFKLTDSLFQKEIISGTKQKYRLHNPKMSVIDSFLKDTHARPKEIKIDSYGYHFVENWPLGKRTWKSGSRMGQSYARCEDCNKCSLCLLSYGLSIDLYCLGHLSVNFSQIIQKARELVFRTKNE